jgi:hypothetical protein
VLAVTDIAVLFLIRRSAKEMRLDIAANKWVAFINRAMVEH